MNPRTEVANIAPASKPRLSLFFATACGAGYLPRAPGTWGSLIGVLLYWGIARIFMAVGFLSSYQAIASQLYVEIAIGIALALFGVWSSSRVARWSGKEDPQFVVIDEVSGQFFTYLFALAAVNWKYLALGFILFRGFDIWKPFPARQAESLPGGWGIMADDWMAAVYAAAGIWIARALGL
jgi:phosphatidylglycerophosphatase A